jgi:hypothetical protein
VEASRVDMLEIVDTLFLYHGRGLYLHHTIIIFL